MVDKNDNNLQPPTEAQALPEPFADASVFEVFEEDTDQFSPELDAMPSPLWEGISDRDTGLGRMLNQLQDLAVPGLSPSGGDMDTDPYLAKVAGEEEIGGTTPTPDQNVVDDLAISAGIEISDKATLHTTEILEKRDDHRWELELESAEDYAEREQ